MANDPSTEASPAKSTGGGVVTDKKSKDESSSKKELRQKIRDQMEFYFSDSNLSKDRFLKQEIASSPDGFVYLTTFLRFNKIRLLTIEPEVIIKSIKKSDILELSEDEKSVRRCTSAPYVEPSQKEIDKRTIYVDNFPPNTNNDQLNKFFSKYGKVGYVSLPKFKSSSQTKGFAFVEFVEKESAKNSIEALSNQTEESNAQITGNFPKTNKKITDLDKKILKVKEQLAVYDDSFSQKPTEAATESMDENSDSGLKRKNESDEPHVKNAKKIKKEDKSLDSLSDIKVLSKKSWLKLKEQFLKKQSDQVDELKLELTSLQAQLDKKVNQKIATKLQLKNVKTDDIHKGCIIKLVPLKATDEKEAYTVLKQNKEKFKEQIAFVDKCPNQICIRCKTKEIAQELLKNDEFMAGFQMKLLDGQEEVDYFEKIFSNRSRKQEKKDKKQKMKESRPTTAGGGWKAEPVKKAETPVKNTNFGSQIKKESAITTGNNKKIVFDNDD